MAQFYTLEEAARVLGMGPDELKQKAQAREVRAFMDGGTWRFRVPDIDELARRRGLGSDPDLAPTARAADAEMDSESDFDLSAFTLGSSDITESPVASAPPQPSGLVPAEDDVLLDDLSLPAGPGALNTSSTIIGAGRSPAESDIRMVGASPGLSDSDVRLASARGGLPGSSAEIKSLTTPPAKPAPPPEEGESSDFELTALDASDEFESTPARKPGDSDVTGFAPAQSGINLGRPSDSGINLQSPGYSGFTASGVEMSPLDEDPSLASDEMSATALPVSKPIFDDTDFELDAAPSSGGDAGDGRTVQLDAVSDFDMDEAGSGSGEPSEVFAIDEEDVDLNAATALGPASSSLINEAPGAGRAASSSLQEPGAVSASGWDITPEAPSSAPSRASAGAPVLASAEARQEWGGVWVGFLMLATVLVLLTGFVGLDLLHNMYGYRGDTPIGTPLVHTLAGLVGS